MNPEQITLASWLAEQAATLDVYKACLPDNLRIQANSVVREMMVLSQDIESEAVNAG